MSTLSEAYQDLPLHPHHVIPLDFDSVRALPDSHAWPPASHASESDDRLSIPTVDLTDPDAGKLIGQACEAWGAFQVTNHAIPLDLLREVESEARRLFSLPTGQKLKALRSPGGATGYGLARISPFFNKYMWHEGFTIMGSSTDHASDLWPNDYQRFCDAMEDYQKRMKELAITLMHLILKSLDISEEERSRVVSAGGASSALQLNSYPFCPDPNRAMGLAPHTDTSLLTILHQSTVNGLQIFKDGVGWVLVSPTNGSLVVNVGDLLHILSNSKFPNVLHRVVLMKENQQRLSLAYFYCLPSDFHLSPLALNSTQMPLYRSVSVRDYIGIKAKNLEKALSLIRF
ncbi:gibberellin beta-hydroxylase family protein [Salix suchowensis]|nr:gibberellin beta-hydroxylase family protein [Salix suchowensis]